MSAAPTIKTAVRRVRTNTPGNGSQMGPPAKKAKPAGPLPAILSQTPLPTKSTPAQAYDKDPTKTLISPSLTPTSHSPAPTTRYKPLAAKPSTSTPGPHVETKRFLPNSRSNSRSRSVSRTPTPAPARNRTLLPKSPPATQASQKPAVGKALLRGRPSSRGSTAPKDPEEGLFIEQDDEDEHLAANTTKGADQEELSDEDVHPTVSGRIARREEAEAEKWRRRDLREKNLWARQDNEARAQRGLETTGQKKKTIKKRVLTDEQIQEIRRLFPGMEPEEAQVEMIGVEERLDREARFAFFRHFTHNIPCLKYNTIQLALPGLKTISGTYNDLRELLMGKMKRWRHQTLNRIIKHVRAVRAREAASKINKLEEMDDRELQCWFLTHYTVENFYECFNFIQGYLDIAKNVTDELPDFFCKEMYTSMCCQAYHHISWDEAPIRETANTFDRANLSRSLSYFAEQPIFDWVDLDEFHELHEKTMYNKGNTAKKAVDTIIRTVFRTDVPKSRMQIALETEAAAYQEAMQNTGAAHEEEELPELEQSIEEDEQ